MSGGWKSELKVLRRPCSLWRLWERILPLPAYGISRCSLACGHITPISLSSHGLLCASSLFLFLIRTLVIGFSPHSQVALVVKNPPANAGDARDVGSIPRSGRSPGEGHGNPLQYSCLENPMDIGAWQAIVLMVPKSWTLLKRLSTAQHEGNPELNYIFIDIFFFFFQIRAQSQFSECEYTFWGATIQPTTGHDFWGIWPTKMPSFYLFFSFLNLTSWNSIILQVPMKCHKEETAGWRAWEHRLWG